LHLSKERSIWNGIKSEGMARINNRGKITPLDEIGEIEEVYPQKPHLY